MGEQHVCIQRAIGQPVLEGLAVIVGANHGAGLDSQVHATVACVGDALDMVSPRPWRKGHRERATLPHDAACSFSHSAGAPTGSTPFTEGVMLSILWFVRKANMLLPEKIRTALKTNGEEWR
jgi:hypothetical protein